MGDYTRLDETIMVLRAAEAERKGPAVGRYQNQMIRFRFCLFHVTATS